MPGYPYINILIMSILFIVMTAMAKDQDMELSVYVAPTWIFILSIIHAISYKRPAKLTHESSEN